MANRVADEDDPMWVTFWDRFKKHVAKREARKAWGQLQPSPELVARIVEALTWQFKQPDWVKDGHQYAPNAASYLRGKRWEDEPRRRATDVPVYHGWDCPHLERCDNRHVCGNKLILGTVKYPLKKAEAS